jgi:hypothetical protein
MSLSTSDMTRITRLNASKTYVINGEVQTKDLFSNVVPFVGKLKTVRETSKIIDFKASQATDYILVSEYSGATSGFGRKLTKTKICNNNGNCTSILLPKVIVRN